MMKSFLQYVAEDILHKNGTNLSRITVVFPNKRASLFLNEELARMANQPIWSPNYITISELFREHSDKTVGDQIKLICDLHKIFNACTGSCETLDRFYGWGQVLLTDFDDIDKNMGDAHQIFTNLKNIHELDDASYLTEEQKELLKKFFGNFSDDIESKLKERFINLWSNFEEIYTRFNECLAQQGLAYEGALYREVVEKTEIDFQNDNYIFVGFNMMQIVEQKLCERLQKLGKAHFYWDFDDYYMKNQYGIKHEAGTYIRQYLKYFPNELDITNKQIYANFEQPKNITYLSATTENIQARYISTWLKQNGRIDDGRRTAIVLADENLLPTVIHCLPPELKHVNITTGYPLQHAPIASFVRLLINLHTMGYSANRHSFSKKWRTMLMRHPYMKYIENQETVFGKVHTDVVSINTWIVDILQEVGHNYTAEGEEDPLVQESIFRMYTLFNRLEALIAAGDLEADFNIYNRLINQLISSTSVPFHGEPIIGLQIMGVLETRNLDFDHILILSCNEGNMPKGVNDTSFIPYAIRKAFGLTTIDNKVAIYAYYFHSLLQRAQDVTLAYNKATSKTATGEMSRFMLQMMVESQQKIQFRNLNAQQVPMQNIKKAIVKNPKVMEVINGIERISPTALTTYLRCQMRFYYRYVAGIKEPDNEEDEIDNRIFGNIFHRAAELFYQDKNHGGIIHESDIEDALKDKSLLTRLVERAFREKLFEVNETRDIKYNGLQLINRQVIIDYLKRLLQIDRKLTPFSILGLEEPVEKAFEIDTPQGPKQIYLFGNIDRIDEIQDNHGAFIRVVDYKTGSNNSMNVKNIDDIFNPEKIDNHTDYYLQAILYSLILRNEHPINAANHPISPALLFIQHATGKDYDPTLQLDKQPITDVANYQSEFMDQLKVLIEDIFNPDISFNPTEKTKQCQYCPYRNICG